ncbi:MAG: hypothetical protein Q9226_005613 [Calogaya cf. arnoldii]
MKSMIISAVFGTAILAIQGVSGAAMPIDIVKRNEAFEVRSEEAHSPAIKRAALPDVLSTNICIHSKWTERAQCFPVTVKPENAAEPSTDVVEKGESSGAVPADGQLKIREADSTNVQVESTTAAATADRSCSAKGSAWYFANPQFQPTCNSELIKGSEFYHHKIDPNSKWNDGIMRVCFEKANCDGGARWGPA